MQISAEDENGILRALLETESDTVREWAERTYAEDKTATTPVTDDQQPQSV